MIMPSLFFAIDWSGAARISAQKKHIWVAETVQDRLCAFAGMTRDELCSWIIANLYDQPAVIGLDFAFSFPVSYFQRLQLRRVGELWQAAANNGEEWLRNCDLPFWGRPGKKCPAAHRELGFRRTDREISVGGIMPKSPLQIGGAGAVGTGSIRGMPTLLRLRDAGFSIWPFDPPRLPMVIEIYPRLLTGKVIKSNRNMRGSFHLLAGCSLEIQKLAEDSEDAFDAIVSALVMQKGANQLADLTQARDAVDLLEGRIWTPEQLS